MATDIYKITLSEKLGVNFDPGESIQLTANPHIKACFKMFLFIAGTVILFQIIAYLFKSEFQWIATLIFFGIGFLVMIGISVWNLLSLRTTTYVITNMSIVIHKDFPDSSTKTIHIKDIKTKELKKTFIDKYFGTGTIKIFTGETRDNDGKTEKQYDYIHSIIEPEKTYSAV
jgi:uncharacterized membrane protein YdbT with pleckstrin-like domain